MAQTRRSGGEEWTGSGDSVLPTWFGLGCKWSPWLLCLSEVKESHDCLRTAGRAAARDTGNFWSYALSGGPDAIRGDRLAGPQANDFGPGLGASLFQASLLETPPWAGPGARPGRSPAARGLLRKSVIPGRVLKTLRLAQPEYTLIRALLLDGDSITPWRLSAPRVPCLEAVGLTARRPGRWPLLPFHYGGNSIYREKASFPSAQWREASC